MTKLYGRPSVQQNVKYDYEKHVFVNRVLYTVSLLLVWNSNIYVLLKGSQRKEFPPQLPVWVHDELTIATKGFIELYAFFSHCQ